MPLRSQRDHGRQRFAPPFPHGCKEREGKGCLDFDKKDSIQSGSSWLAWNGSSPAPAETGWPLELPPLCLASLLSAWMLTAGLSPPACSHGKGSGVSAFASTDILRKAHAFFRQCTIFGEKTGSPQNVCPKFFYFGCNRSFFFLSFSFPRGGGRMGSLQ